MDSLPHTTRTDAAGGPSDASEQIEESGVPRPIASEQLLQGRSCVMIRHGDAVYALRATRAGKLILTK
ncbi:hemin uptake protein HemP [Pseudothauera nasutitermitis]|uniref:Hemin uptake protein HemP n=2 Tax=Pseudothauera nasutitermitis TaxID=2565930 RepID=A0A4S4B055_9RHOO|nr:hemin uptake protein HemP [Pseudothauera nasutitermitis]